MKIKPVESTPAPGYPDKYGQEIRQALPLAQPKRWKGAPLALGLLSAAVALGLNGCKTDAVLNTGLPADDHAAAGISTPGATPVATSRKKTLQALKGYIPVFEFGDGTGVVGCDVSNRPIFLSEEEAFAMLSAAFADAGFTLTQDTQVLAEVNLPHTKVSSRTDDTVEIHIGEMETDGTLKAIKDIPVEFVSFNDVFAFCKEGSGHPLVEYGKTKVAAKELAANNPGLVVFYDPLVYREYPEREEDEDPNDYWERLRSLYAGLTENAYAQSEEMLRQQVQAFVEWLRTEGSY